LRRPRARIAAPWRHAITVLAAGLTLAAPSLAAEKSPAAKKKPAAKQVAHHKASPEQIRRFNELAKKRQETK
jgi:hypothetical protein